MIGMKFVPDRGGFFNVAKIIAAADRKTFKVLSRFGAFTRRRAQTSIRKRKKPSQPGMPPSGHTGALRRFIKFDVDMRSRSVIIGPELLPGKVGRAPASLEHGGESARVVLVKGAREEKEIVVQQRPFMGPAFEKEKQTSLPKLWAGIPFK